VILYLDTSAVGKLLVQEAESEALAQYLDGAAASGSTIASSSLLETELRRLAERVGIPQPAATEVLRRLDIIDLDRGMFREAGLLPGASLRSLDALYIAVGLRVAADEFVTYDTRQAQAAQTVGLSVVSPAVGTHT
jgi:predicted nucleic acid-binding protein